MQIRQGIDQWKKHMKYKSISPEGDSDLPEEKYFNVEIQTSDNLSKKAHLHGIKNTSMDPHTMFELEDAFSHDLAYNCFRIRLGRFMSGFLNLISEGGIIAQGQWINYTPDDKASILSLKKKKTDFTNIQLI